MPPAIGLSLENSARTIASDPNARIMRYHLPQQA
jgi:hypothetical protein